MNRLASKSFVAFQLLAAAWLPRAVVAETVPTPSADQSKWPAEVVVNIGDVRTRIDGPKLKALKRLEELKAYDANANR